jgi:putative hydrolase of the HAD superfamily
MPGPTVAAICLDAGGTLLHCDPPPPVIYAEHLSRFGRPVVADEVAIAFRQAWFEMQRRTAPGVDRYGTLVGGEYAWWGAFVRTVLQRLRHDAPWEPLLDALYRAFARADIWRTFPDTLPALTGLRQRGVALAVVSNWDRRLLGILDGLELTPFFTALCVSSLEGVEKPGAEIFHRALRRLGLDASESIHVGDSPFEDYDGAAAAGLTPLLIDRTGRYEGQSYRTIASLEALVEIVDKGLNVKG